MISHRGNYIIKYEGSSSDLEFDILPQTINFRDTIITNSYLRNINEDQETDCYKIADATWKNMVNEIIQWIYDNGGVANLSRDNFQHHIDRDKLRDYLEENITLDQLTDN